MSIKIETDKYEILGNGSLIIDHNHPIYFKLFDETMIFKIVFDLLEQKDMPVTDLKLLEDEENVFQVKIGFPRRHDSTTSTKSPLHLAYKNGKNVYLKFSFKYQDVKHRNEELDEAEDMVFHYTWLKDK